MMEMPSPAPSVTPAPTAEPASMQFVLGIVFGLLGSVCINTGNNTQVRARTSTHLRGKWA